MSVRNFAACLFLLAGSALVAGARPGFGFGVGYPFGWAYEPWWFGGYATGYRAFTGEVKLEGAERGASVFLDGAYAGDAGHLKHMWLDPGAYDLEIRSAQGPSRGEFMC